MARTTLIALLVLGSGAAVCAAGCSIGPFGRPGATLRAESLGEDPVFLKRDYAYAVYARLGSTETSFFLTDIPMEDLLTGNVSTGMVVHLDLLWQPSAGNTPMDRSATNVSVRYIVFADGEVGIYGGAGFAMPRGKLGKGKMSLSLRDASLTLLDSTGGFIDLLSPARLTGTVTAGLNKKRARQMSYALNQIVTNALGYTRLVGTADEVTSSPGV